VQDDIVKTLRDWADSAYEQGVENMITGLWDAANEIEKLRAEVDRLKRSIGCARDQRSTQYCAEALDAQREMERLRAELVTMTEMFNAARCSTAPTPANTGGGADHQIPEAL